MTISGVIPLRNAAKLGYPFELAIRSLQMLCDETVVLVDPTGEDDTLRRVRDLYPDVIVESTWNMDNHDPEHTEIAVQTDRACSAASGDWIFSLQADEVLHEDEIAGIRVALAAAERLGVKGIQFLRLYFYGSLNQTREDWTLWILRLFKRGWWKSNEDAMQFVPVGHAGEFTRPPQRIFHYSRIGDPQQIADRVRNLDLFFHAPETVAPSAPPYDFTGLRKLDTYVIGHEAEIAPEATLRPFRLDEHPAAAREYFRVG